MVIFVTLSTALAMTKAPWCDEGWFANPAYNLAFHGNMGSNVLEPSGHFLNAYLSGIQERTYVVPPNHIVALAGWFRLFGFSMLAMRAYSICWSALALPCVFYILFKLFPDRRIAQFGILLTSIDFIYLWSSADGRMDASASALAWASVAAYLYLRERNLGVAVFVSQSLGAAAVFTHPNAALVILALAVLVWRNDLGRLQVRHVLMAAAPYIFFAALWSLYILQSPYDFKAQFLANAAGRDSSRWKTVLQPWLALRSETVRHLGTYVASGLWSGRMSKWMLFVPIFYISALVSFLRNRRTYPFSVRSFLACLLTLMFGMTFLNGFKAPNYLIYILPLYNAVMAFWLLNLWKRASDAKLIAAGVGVAFAALHFTAFVQHIQADEYHRDYQKAIAILKEDQSAGKTILGTAALGFGLGFNGFADDWRLGQYSHVQPDVLVIDRSYREFAKKYGPLESGVFAHIVRALSKNYRLTIRAGSFWIFERVSPDSPLASRPNIDLHELGLKPNGEQADYLFRQLLANEGIDSTKESTRHDEVRF